MVSEAGRLTTSRHCLASFADSVRAWAGEMRLEVTTGQILCVMVQLPGIGDPLVDQDQAGAILVEKFAQHVSGTGGLFIVGGNARS